MKFLTKSAPNIVMNNELISSMSSLNIGEEGKSSQRKYNMYVLQAKKLEKEGKFKDSIQNYEKAFKILPKEDLKAKIDSLKRQHEETDSEEEYDFESSRHEEEEEEEDYEEPEKENLDKKALNIVESKSKQETVYEDKEPFIYDKQNNVYTYTHKEKKFNIDPKTLNSLYEYQRNGIQWLFEKHFNLGCILGDGKQFTILT
jgi:hypothetical protein